MQLGARAYVAKYNLDERSDDKQPSAEKLGYELYKDLTSDYFRLRRKGNLFTTDSGRKLFWMLHAGVTRKMEAIEDRTTAPMDWVAVISYFGIKTLEFYKDEGLSTNGTNKSDDSSKHDSRIGHDGISIKASDQSQLN